MANLTEDEKTKLFNKLDDIRNQQHEIQKQQHKINQALFGDEEIGLKGVVSELEDLKVWKGHVDLKTSGIAGGVAVIVVFGKYLGAKVFGINE